MAGCAGYGAVRTFIAQGAEASVENVTGVGDGGHGDTMVPLVRLSNVAGIPLTELLDQATCDRLVDRARNGGRGDCEVSEDRERLLRSIAAAVEMWSPFSGQEEGSALCPYLEGEYGISGLFVGVPVKLGARVLSRSIRSN